MSGKYRKAWSLMLSLALVCSTLSFTAVPAAAEEPSIISQEQGEETAPAAESIEENEPESAAPQVVEEELPADEESADTTEELPASRETEPGEETAPSYDITMPALTQGMPAGDLAAGTTIDPAGTEYEAFFWDMAGVVHDEYREGYTGWAVLTIRTEQPERVSLNGRSLSVGPLDDAILAANEDCACFGEMEGQTVLYVVRYVLRVPADGPEVDIELPDLTQYIHSAAELREAISAEPESMRLERAFFEAHGGKRYCRLEFAGLESCPSGLKINGEPVAVQTNTLAEETRYGESPFALYYDGGLSLSIPAGTLQDVVIGLPELRAGMTSLEYGEAVETRPEGPAPLCSFNGEEELPNEYLPGETLFVQLVYEMEECPGSLSVDGETVTVETDPESIYDYDLSYIYALYEQGELTLLVPLRSTPVGEAESMTLPALTEGLTPERLLAQVRTQPEGIRPVSCSFLDEAQEDQECFVPGETAWIGFLQEIRPESLQVNGEDIYVCSGIMEAYDCLAEGRSFAVDLTGQYGIFVSLLPEGTPGECTHSIRVAVAGRRVTCTEDGVAGGTYCARCGEGKAEAEAVIRATGHTIEEGVAAQEPSCTREGFTGYTWCSTCKAILAEGETLPALGHDLGSDYKCTRCGKTQYPCTAPVLSKVENTTGGVTLTWEAVSGAPQYRVFRKVPGGSWTKLGVTTDTTFTDSKAASGTTYIYTARVLSEDGGVYISDYDRTGLTILYLSALKPSLSNTSTGITVKWSKVTGAKGYYVYRKTSGGSYAKIKTISDGSTVSYTDTASTLTNGTGYTYAVRAYSGSTKGSYTGKSIYRLTGKSISSLSNIATRKLVVKWTRDSKVTGYQVQYSTASDFSGAKTVTIEKNSTLSTTISSLTKGKTYYVRLRTYKKTSSGTTYYSAWSSKKYLKISK